MEGCRDDEHTPTYTDRTIQFNIHFYFVPKHSSHFDPHYLRELQQHCTRLIVPYQ